MYTKKAVIVGDPLQILPISNLPSPMTAAICQKYNIDKKKILKVIDYEHPLFDVAAVKAQQELYKLNEKGPLYFCGSYFKYGFHEDAYASAVALSEKLLNG